MTLKIVTHDGKFHPDEIFASVLLSMFHVLEKVSFVRTRNVKSLERYKSYNWTYVIDVGSEYNPLKNNFDHHQSTFTDTGDKGDVLSSFGLIWKHIRDNEHFRKVWYITDFIADKITEFTIAVDRHDNGVEYMPELEFINMYNFEPAKSDVRFRKAFKAAETYFNQKMRLWQHLEYVSLLEDEAIKNAKDGIIFSEEKIGVSEKLNCTPNYLLVAPRSDKEYVINSLNVTDKIDFSIRCPAPEEWRGLSEKDIRKFDKKLVFTHKSGFITIVKGSKEDAMRIAEHILKTHLERRKEAGLKFVEEMRNGDKTT